MNDDVMPLRFNGSVWCNVDIALRNLGQQIDAVLKPLDITIVELYILRALYEEDGQHASALAKAIGRAATSFTPNLDKLAQKGWIERQPDPNDRRAVFIYLTAMGRECKDNTMEAAKQVDERIERMFPAVELQTFRNVLAVLQTTTLG